MRDFCDRALDKFDSCVSPFIYLRGKAWHAFRVFSCAGLAFASLFTIVLVAATGRRLESMVTIIITACATFLTLTLIRKILIGRETLVYYHYEIAVLLVTAGLLWLMKQPILPYLDITALGIGLCLAFTRIGCQMVGCCHGKPCRFGICYGARHARAGFTPYYVGIRLFPIQAVESLWTFCIVLIGSILILRNYPPGEALAWYIIMYGLGRFCFEFVRGDPERFYFLDFSEAQWTSLVLISATVWAEFSGILPFHRWHVGALACIVLTAIAVSLRRRFQATDKYHLLHPHHVKEVAEALELTSKLTPENSTISNVHVACTSLGIKISASKIKTDVGCIYHYALSGEKGDMTRATARNIVKLILQLTQSSGSIEFIERSKGVFHLLIHPSTRENAIGSG